MTPKPTKRPDAEAQPRTETHSPVTVAADQSDTDRRPERGAGRWDFGQCASGGNAALDADMQRGPDRGQGAHRDGLKAWRESGLAAEAGS